MKFFVTCVLVLFLTSTCYAGEREQVERIAEKYHAKTEVRLWDNTRVDLLNETHAIEVDWSHKYSEGIGQAIYYAAITGKKPGLVLLVKDLRTEQRFIYRAQIACIAAGVDLYVETLPKPKLGRQPSVANDTPIRVYFIHDPVDDKWYSKGNLGLTAWGDQREAYVWTVRRNVERTLMTLFGRRAERCIIKAFILIPAKDNE